MIDIVEEIKKEAFVIRGDSIFMKPMIHRETKEKAGEFVVYNAENNLAMRIIVNEERLKKLLQILKKILEDRKEAVEVL